MEAVNGLLAQKTELLATYGMLVDTLTDTKRLEKEAARLQQAYDETVKQMEVSIQVNASVPLDQADYQQKYDELIEAANTAKADLRHANSEIVKRKAQRKMLLAFMRELERRDGVLAEFDGELWTAVVDSVSITTEEMQFKFKDGSVQSVKIQK